MNRFLIGSGLRRTSITPGHWGVAGAVVLWALGNLIIRQVPMAPAQIAFWRVLMTVPVYWGILVARGRQLSWSDIKASAPAGIAIGLELWIFFTALKTTTIANATVLGNLQPFVVMAFGMRRFGERVTAWLIGGAIAAVSGVVLVIYGASGHVTWSLKGDLLALLAMVLFAGYFIYAKEARRTVAPFEFQTSVWLVAAAVLAPVAVIDAGGVVVPTSEQMWWLLALMIVPATGHLLMNWAHGVVHLSIASLATLVIPVISSVGAVFLFSETLRPLQLIGMAVVLTALAYVIAKDAQVEPVVSKT